MKQLVEGTAVKAVAIAASIALALALAFFAQPAYAAGDEEASESTPPANDEVSFPAVGGLPLMGNDYVWFGERLNLEGHTMANDLLAAGRDVTLRDCEVAGSVRVAAQDIELDGLNVSENVTVAGESIAIGDTKANAVSATGRQVTFGGSCESLVAYANDVVIDGVVKGDVVVGANSVTVGANARILGTLHVDAPSNPTIQSGAEVANVEYTKSEDGASAEEVEGVLAGFASTFAIVMSIIGIIATLIIAVLAEWLFRRHTAAAADMIRVRTGALIGTGVVGAIVAPVAIIVLCVLVVTLPVAGALILALLALSVVAGGFAGASLFKLAFPRLGRFACALAGGAIVGVASAIPYLGVIVDVAAFMYLLGYVLQSVFLGTRTPDPTPQNGSAIPVAATNAPEPPASAGTMR